MLSKDDNQTVCDMLVSVNHFPSVLEGVDKNKLLQEFYEDTPASLCIDTPFNQATIEQARLMYGAALGLVVKLHELATPLIDDYASELAGESEADDQYDEQEQEELETKYAN